VTFACKILTWRNIGLARTLLALNVQHSRNHHNRHDNDDHNDSKSGATASEA
jgi:hypothetical protein